MPGFDRGGGGGEDHRAAFEQPAHHRDVARVIMDPVLLLETRFMRLVDDDQSQRREGQEQRGTRADGDARLAAGDRAPRAAALRRAQPAVPGDRLAAEAIVETLQERLGQRDLGQQHEHLPAGPQRGGDRLEIDFGLARSGDAVEQRGAIRRRVDIGDQPLRRRALIG